MTAASARSPAQRSPSPKGEGDRLRDEVLAAADAILRETGNAEVVTMRAVAARVGCTPAAIYLHFADRTELIFAVCTRHFEALDRALARAIRGIDDPLEELRAVGRAYVRFGLRHPEEYRTIFMGHPSDFPADLDVAELLDVGGFARAVTAVQRCLDARVISASAGTAFEIATRMWVVVHGFTAATISKPWFPWGDRATLVEALLETQIRGLQASS
jgi:AcrR family transcriptional regulator